MAHAPDAPTQLPKRSWWAVLKRTVKEFNDDNLTDWAAALTYYAVLSLFPGLLLLTSLLGLLGPDATQSIKDSLDVLGPGEAKDLIVGGIDNLQKSSGVAGPLAIVGLVTALWSASGYVGAFMRAANSIYDVEEGRPFWKVIPLRLALTVGVVVLLALTALGVTLTGGVARWLGDLLGLGETFVSVWDIAKWPVLFLLASLAIGLLFWASPNVRQPSWLWITPGGVLAVLAWVVASTGFALYVANAGSYNKTYGSLAGVIVFLVWLWISNLALLLGAELDAELERGRRMAAGESDGADPVAPPRDTQAMDEPDDGRQRPAGGL
ncbi:YihY/virulence factor BrkB family protein [Saccharothrix algeriensis]|uniref:Membrane protein n=1 Tax=Saccharothrix algeriensis TaxID=173560 RepID=A0A8T8I0M0_9PSEU|nr:YihY/virulence factor BrkB family protein [Saccharothrix algeriensis]MBM7809977.1 membrane protein [Saccharothrix algeriensis]QTR04221.1 YihY/virulence factor BrkB family protein [Saccharothrix algeriensis]